MRTRSEFVFGGCEFVSGSWCDRKKLSPGQTNAAQRTSNPGLFYSYPRALYVF
jgi:hypothetical protein